MLAFWYAVPENVSSRQEKPDLQGLRDRPAETSGKLNRTDDGLQWFNGPHLKLASFDKDGNAEVSSAVTKESAEKKIIDVTTLWQNYLLCH